MADDNDVSLPKTTLQKMIKDLMPSDMRVSSETVEVMINCCTEFIQLMSSESNEVAMKENRSIINPEHVVKALRDLGFPEFLSEVNAAWEQFKEESKSEGGDSSSSTGVNAPAVPDANSRKADLRKTGADKEGMSEEEQIALQQQMFAAARAQSMTTPESAAAMQQAYEQALAAQALALQEAGSEVPEHLQPYLLQHQQQPSGGQG